MTKQELIDIMTDKQQIFCDRYVENNFNGTQACITAGYSEKTASVIANENLRKPYLKEYIDILIDEKLSDVKKRGYRVLNELEKIAYGEGDIKTDDEGNVIGVNKRDKLKALELLGKNTALFVEKIEWGKNVIVKNNAGGPVRCYYQIWAARKYDDKLHVEYKGDTPADYPGDNTRFSIAGYDYDRR